VVERFCADRLTLARMNRARMAKRHCAAMVRDRASSRRAF